ncbi:MAG: glycosyltransferase family 2 protein [bacterium]
MVIPVFNEAQTLPELHRRLMDVMASTGLAFELLFVNDGSIDHSGEIVRAFCAQDRRVKLIELSRNFGHRPALAAGIDRASGDAVVIMDGDLQDKPEVIADFVAKWREGYDVVYAVRTSRKENPLSRALFKAFYWLLVHVSGIRQPPDAGNFSLLDRRAAQVLKALPERNRYYPGLRAFIGFRQTGIPVDRDARFFGTSRVQFTGLIRLACDAVFSFSFAPLRLATYLGLAVASCAFLYLLVVLYYRLFTDQAITGWASTLGAILFLGGVQLVTLGVLGEYIGRIYDETKQRPYFIVAESLNMDDPA